MKTAYIGSSFKEGLVGWSSIVQNNKTGELEFRSGIADNKNIVLTGSIGGMMLAVVNTTSDLILDGDKEVEVVYSYKGIKEWTEEKEPSLNDVKNSYQKTIKSMRKCINIKFTKVSNKTMKKCEENANELALKAIYEKIQEEREVS